MNTNTIIHGDSAEELFKLDRESVDMVITSPPYSDLRKYGGVGDTWNENDIVLDPFMGSGMTALSCINNNRRYIGIELNKEYVDLSLERINNQTIS